MNRRRTIAIARKELIHIVRDTRSLLAAIMQPILVLLLFGYALSLDVDQVPTVIYDADRSPQSESLGKQFEGSRYFNVIQRTDNYGAIELAMEQRRALVGIVIPTDYSTNLAEGKEAKVQILLDGSDSNTASISSASLSGGTMTGIPPA